MLADSPVRLQTRKVASVTTHFMEDIQVWEVVDPEHSTSPAAIAASRSVRI